MKERPILFSGPMVRAILEGRKTQTRRIYKPSKGYPKQDGEITPTSADTWTEWGPCPYGQPGDRLWVREAWASIRPSLPDDEMGSVIYRADSWYPEGSAFVDHPIRNPERWKPSIHMPRWASRITLEVVSVRAERLQAITGPDCFTEMGMNPYGTYVAEFGFEVRRFRELWDSINAKRGHGWETDPWVWVVEFKAIGGAA